MEIHEIRYFLTLCRTLNFRRAAEACNITQPALTRAISKMEGELGGLLFARERKNTHLTELGRLIQPHLMEVLAQTQAAKQSAARFLRLDSASLSVGVMCTIAPVQFVTFLSHFRSNSPGIELTLRESVPDVLCELLIRGELDVALMARPDGFYEPLTSEPLYSERFVIACAAGHRLAGRAEIPLSELDGEYYFSRINCEFRDVLAEACASRNIGLQRSYRSERDDWILTMVAAGLGVCMLPEYTAAFPGVVGRRFIEPAVAREVCAVTVADRPNSAPLATFLKAVQYYPWPADMPAPPAAKTRRRQAGREAKPEARRRSARRGPHAALGRWSPPRALSSEALVPDYICFCCSVLLFDA